MSFANEMEKLAANTTEGTMKEASLMLFTASRLTPDMDSELDGFILLRVNRTRESGKRKGG